VRIERFLQVHTGLANKFLELGNLADFFEGEDLILLVAVNGEPSRVITAVFEPRKTWRERESSVSKTGRGGLAMNAPFTRVSRMYFRSFSTR
jgi:hypothetical protein